MVRYAYVGMIFHSDALLPTAERYASPKFRRVARTFNAYDLDYGDALELVAFLGVLPVYFSRHVFHWKGTGIANANLLLGHESLVKDAQPFVEDNLQRIDEGDGLMMLTAMIDGGWSRGKTPVWSRRALQAGWDRGESAAAQAKAVGLTRDQIQYMRTPRKRRKSANFVGFAGSILGE
jgi:hypothetical protein